jgi:hypothetical protein
LCRCYPVFVSEKKDKVRKENNIPSSAASPPSSAPHACASSRARTRSALRIALCSSALARSAGSSRTPSGAMLSLPTIDDDGWSTRSGMRPPPSGADMRGLRIGPGRGEFSSPIVGAKRFGTGESSICGGRGDGDREEDGEGVGEGDAGGTPASPSSALLSVSASASSEEASSFLSSLCMRNSSPSKTSTTRALGAFALPPSTYMTLARADLLLPLPSPSAPVRLRASASESAPNAPDRSVDNSCVASKSSAPARRFAFRWLMASSSTIVRADMRCSCATGLKNVPMPAIKDTTRCKFPIRSFFFGINAHIKHTVGFGSLERGCARVVRMQDA